MLVIIDVLRQVASQDRELRDPRDESMPGGPRTPAGTGPVRTEEQD